MATPFQESVWEALKLIPPGRVTTYGAIAAYLGSRAVRAVGSAVAKNPYAPQIPCHRVVKADGTVGAYSGPGGQKSKIALLREEGIPIEGERIVSFETYLFDFVSEEE